MDTDNKISEEHLKKVCRPGAGAETCRFIVCGTGGFECAKRNKTLGPILFVRALTGQRVAQGDNCEGLGGEPEDTLALACSLDVNPEEVVLGSFDKEE